MATHSILEANNLWKNVIFPVTIIMKCQVFSTGLESHQHVSHSISIQSNSIFRLVSNKWFFFIKSVIFFGKTQLWLDRVMMKYISNYPIWLVKFVVCGSGNTSIPLAVKQNWAKFEQINRLNEFIIWLVFPSAWIRLVVFGVLVGM